VYGSNTADRVIIVVKLNKHVIYARKMFCNLSLLVH